jgi:hypothetical protein
MFGGKKSRSLSFTTNRCQLLPAAHLYLQAMILPPVCRRHGPSQRPTPDATPKLPMSGLLLQLIFPTSPIGHQHLSTTKPGLSPFAGHYSSLLQAPASSNLYNAAIDSLLPTSHKLQTSRLLELLSHSPICVVSDHASARVCTRLYSHCCLLKSHHISRRKLFTRTPAILYATTNHNGVCCMRPQSHFGGRCSSSNPSTFSLSVSVPTQSLCCDVQLQPQSPVPTLV